MKGTKWSISRITSGIASSIALSFVAACGTMSVSQHRSEAQRYAEAARVARDRGDSTEAVRDEALARKHETDARDQEERGLLDFGGAP